MILIDFLRSRRESIQTFVVFQGVVLGFAFVIELVQGGVRLDSYGFTLTILGTILIVVAALSSFGSKTQTPVMLVEHASSLGLERIEDHLQESQQDKQSAFGFISTTLVVGVLSIGFGILMFFL